MSQLDSLFPAPSRPAGKLIPHVLGEVTTETVRAVVECLRDDYEKNHVFFNDKGFHNHTMHFVLALYYLGADEGLIRSVYVAEAANQRKVVSSPEPITHENFADHLGDEKFYQSYFDFFSDAVLKHGASETIEKYIFANEVNTPSTRLICRFMSVFLHPFIHTGYGFEFNLPGMVAEGLAQTYVHYIHDSEMFIPSLYQTPPSRNSVSSTLPSAQSKTTSNSKNVASNGAAPCKVHALAILHKLYKLRLPFTSFSPDSSFSLFSSVPETAAKIQEHVELWLSTLALNSSDDVENAIEELAWTASAVYGLGGWRDGDFKADFFLVHLLTSSLFLPSVAQSLSSASQRKLLGAYFTALLSVYIWRLSPALCFKSFYEASLTSMHSSNSQPLVAHPRFLNAGAQENNLWPGIINNAIHHPEAHVSKAIRALEHWASLYGKTPKGKFTSVEVGWEDAEHIDGTLFVRIASLTVNALGRVADGEEHKEWYNERYTSN